MKNIGNNKGAFNTSSSEIHPGNAKRLNALVEDYVLTMQHAVRHDLKADLIARAEAEAQAILPPLSPGEMFDYLMDTDEEFLNWCFPFCAVKLNRNNLGYLHQRILSDYRKALQDTVIVEPVNVE